MKPRYRIAIQSNGRLRAGSLAWLQSLGLMLPNLSDRMLLIPARNAPIDIIFMRHSDIPTYVEQGIASYGIVGANLLAEQQPTVQTLQRFSFGDCKLVIATREQSNLQTIQQLADKRIATAYPVTLKQFLLAQNISVDIVTMRGSVEVAPQLNLADAICDLTQTGSTLKAHQLIPIQTILESTATLITAADYQPQSTDPIYQLMQLEALRV